MFMVLACRGRVSGLALAVAMTVSVAQVVAQMPPNNLFTAGNAFTSNSHYVSTAVFTWFTSTGGQVDGPWRPLEGRTAWTGEPDFWKIQVKQMMAANIDVLQIVHFPGWDQQRTNLFQEYGRCAGLTTVTLNCFTMAAYSTNMARQRADDALGITRHQS